MPAEFYDEDGFRLSFENDTSPDERQYFMRAFPNVSKIAERRIHCTTCNAHIGTAPVSEAVIRMHPVLRVTHCRNCHAFYNSGDFDKGEDGSELYCRWCGQGGEVFCCSKCPYVFCKSCIVRNLSRACVQDIVRNENWHCFGCAPRIMWHLRAQHWALDNFIEKQKKEIKNQDLSPNVISALMKKDRTTCCPGKGQNRKSVNATATAPMITSPVSATKKTAAKRTYGEVSGKREGSMEGGPRLEPVVSIPPLAHSILGQLDVDPGIALPGNAQGDAAIASSSGSVGSPVTTSSSSGKAAGSKKPRKSSTPNSDSGQAARPPQAKKKRMAGNNEVVCTPDIMSMLSDDGPTVGQPQTTPSRPPIVTVGGKPLVPIAPKPAPYVDPATGSPMMMPGNGALPGPMSKVNVPKQKAILHHSIPRNLAVSVPGSRISMAPLDHPEQVGPQTVRVSSTAPRQSTGGSAPMYHTFEGYQIDLQAASQQSTYRLPNGKLILVRKQTADGSAQNATETVISPVQPPKVAPGMSGPIPGNRLLNNNVTSVPPGAASGPMVVRNGQEMRRVPATHVQRQQAMQHQQRVQMQMAQMAQQNDQYQQQFQRMQQRMDQRTTGQRAMAQRMQQQQQQQQQQQLQQQLPQPGMYVGPAAPGAGGIVYPAAGGAAPAVVPVPVQQAPPSPAGNAQQPAILALLRGLVNGPHEETPLGSARKDFEAKMLAGAEICHHILGKIYSLTNSNSFKNIRNLRDLKELFIHLSYLMTYGIGRFKTLHERCVDDVKKMGFTKESDFVMMGERVNNRNPEDDNSEDDDDCEIIEQNTTVIEVDSDDEAASTTGKEKAATEGAAGGSSAKKAPKTVAQPAAPKDGPANTLTVGEIVVTWKVTGVSDTPGQTQTPAQNDKEGPRAANTDNVAVAGEIVVAPKKTTPAAAAATPAGEGSNENASHDTSDKDSNNTVEVTIEALNSSGTGNLSSSTETMEMMETEANNSVTDSEGPVVTALPNKLTATQTPEVASPGNEDIDLGAADKDEVEMIEISDKEVSELLDIHASSNAATEKDAQSEQKDESIEITDSDDAGQNGSSTEKSEAGKEAAENATTVSADDTVETLSDDKSADAELDASDQKADDATTCTDKASLPDDMEQSSKESSSEVLDLMDAADDSYHSDSSDIQFGAECDALDSAATHKDGNAGVSSSVKNSEPKTGESEKNKPSLPSETKKGETVESTNEAEISKQQEKQAVEQSAVIDLDASSTESDGNKSATEEDANASKKGGDASTKEDDTATKNESVATKQQEKSEAAAEPSAIIDLDASSTESYDNKSATEEDVDASNKDSEPAVQEEISEICTNESIDESLMTDPAEPEAAGVEVSNNKEESTDNPKVQEVAEEIEEIVGEKVDTTSDGSSELQSQEKETPDDSVEIVECEHAEKIVSVEDDVVSAETSSEPVNSNSEPMDTEDGQLSCNDAEVMEVTEEQERPSSSHGQESTEMDASEGMEQEAKDLPNTEQLQLAEVEVVDSSLMPADSSSITNNNKPTASDSDNEKEGQLPPPSQSTAELSSESSTATPVVNSIVSKKVEAAADNSSNEREESEADELFTTPPELAEQAPSSMEVDSSNLNSEP